ncbi:MAG: hypothetical protein AB7F31_07080 [Parachlamydiales bacterium]
MKPTRRLHPFTRRMGTPMALPGTSVALRIFPTRIEVIGGEAVDLPIRGPAGDFLAIQDLERGGIHVSVGPIRYTILPGRPLSLKLTKGSLDLPWQGEPLPTPLPQERLFFGSHKKLDWPLVERRCDPRELFPLWHRLGLALPPSPPELGPSLLSEAADTPSLLTLFRAGFAGLFVPHRSDPLYQGFPLPPLTGADPFALLSLGAQKIRSLFYGDGPLRPPREFPAGRHLHIPHPLGLLSYEWSKHRLRKMELVCHTSGEFPLGLPKEIKRYRAEGRFLDAHTPYPVSQGETYPFDRFER